MPSRKRRPTRKRTADVSRPAPAEAPDDPRRGSLLPTILWGVAMLLGLALLVGLILAPFTVGLTPGSRWAFLGGVIVVGVVVFGLGAKTAEAYLDWKEPDT